ncbi:MAG TPA: GntR family transcriptional regulator [Streptosporangiaceae bacterium]|nr:GntR family transcriptional regulator [Streptosporangiaceae bacterium]
MEAREARLTLRAVSAVPAEGTAYRHLAADFRQAIAAGRYPAGQKLPTEAELVASTGLSRQTVRRAFQDLVSEGIIYRVRGRGTFAIPGDGRYLRSFGSIDDLMALSLDTEMEVVEPLHVLASVQVAGQLQAADDLVMTTSFLRLHDGVPFCYTRLHVPLEIGRRLRALPELAALADPGARTGLTMISLVDRVSDRPIDSAVQNATAVAGDPDTARRLGCPSGVPLLRIERLYRDRDLAPLELAVNHFHPDRYSYRLQLRGRVHHPAGMTP